MSFRYTRLTPNAVPPTRAHHDDAGFDLCASESARLEAGERASIGTGIAVEIPEGSAGLVLPRSGLAARHGISVVNAPGLIDSGYRGEVRVLLLNTDRNETFEIAPGDRIAQLVIVEVGGGDPEEAESLADSVRGSGGFGSTGR